VLVDGDALRLLGGDGGHRVLEGAPPPGLDLADHQDVAVPRHDVDLAGPATAPVALQDRHPGVDQPLCGHRLAVLAE
jgi:hypothetical protein